MQNDDMNNMQEYVPGFSWKRVWMVACYWWPLLRWKLSGFLLISVLVGTVAAFFYVVKGDYVGMQITGMSTYLCIFGSAVFGKKSGHQLDVGLPARNSEKLTFMLAYNILVLPLVTIIPCSVIMYLIMGQCPYQLMNSILTSVGVRYTGFFYYTTQLYSIVLMMVSALVCLWTATTARRHALGKAIGFSLLTFITPSFLTGLVGGLGLFGYIKQKGVNDMLGSSQDELLEYMFDNMGVIFSVESIMLLIAWIVCLCLFIRNFNKRQC